MLVNLHLLRVIAALGVVYFHTTSTAGLKLDWDVGSRGVDVFFVISGFIIAYIGTAKPDRFLVRRLIRVVPFYWAATLAVFAAAALLPSVFHTTTANVPHLLASLAFVPHAHAGEMMPTLSLGWSLNFEMFFYILFALGLAVGGKQAPKLCVGALLGLVLVAQPLAGHSDILDFYARPIVLEFCMGIGVFYLFDYCSARREALRGSLGLRLLLIAAFVGSLVVIVVGEEYGRDEIPRYLMAGIPSFFLVASAVLLERIYGLSLDRPLLRLLGEASYIIYLIHPYVVFTVLRVVAKGASHWSSPMLAVLILALLVLTSALAIAIHLWFEKPIMQALRRRFAAG